MNDDFDMADVRRRLASIESGKHDGEFHYVFDLVHAVHSELLKIAKSTITKVNQGLHNRLPEDITCELAATPDMHPHLRAQKSSGRDWETVGAYIQ